ncbi:hypothetical protein Tco_1168428, partial [Tanacetum coccineum]
MYYPRFTKAIIHHFLIQEKSLSRRNKIRMHTSKDDYLINSVRFVFAKESTQIYGAILPECLTSPAMKESTAYKTYLGYATDEEPVQKGKRVKRPAKKSTTKPTAYVVIREAPVETKRSSDERSKKEELKGLSKKPPSVDKITPTVTSEGTGDKPGVLDVTEDDSTESESESWGNDEDNINNDQDSSNEDKSEDDDQEEEEFVHTPSPTDDKDDDNLESESDDVNKSNEESDDVINGDKEIVQGEGVDAEMTDTQQGNENLETTQEQVIEDAHVTISTVTKKIEVPVTSSSRLSYLASKFLNFLDILHTCAEIVSPLDVHVHHEVLRTQAPTLFTILIFVITESSPVLTNIPQSSQTFTPSPILT